MPTMVCVVQNGSIARTSACMATRSVLGSADAGVAIGAVARIARVVANHNRKAALRVIIVPPCQHAKQWQLRQPGARTLGVQSTPEFFAVNGLAWCSEEAGRLRQSAHAGGIASDQATDESSACDLL